MKSYTYRVIIEQDGDQFHGYVPALSGCHTYGDTIAQTKSNLKEAIQVYVEGLGILGEVVPEEKSFESFETVIINSKPLYV